MYRSEGTPGYTHMTSIVRYGESADCTGQIKCTTYLMQICK